MIKHRIIQLTCNVRNPEPDRRSKGWYKLPELQAGARFIVWEGNDGQITLHSSNHQYGHVYGNQPLAKLILQNSVGVDPVSVRELSEVHGCDFGGDEILRMLVKLGRVTPADFAAVAEAASADENF